MCFCACMYARACVFVCICVCACVGVVDGNGSGRDVNIINLGSSISRGIPMILGVFYEFYNRYGLNELKGSLTITRGTRKSRSTAEAFKLTEVTVPV